MIEKKYKTTQGEVGKVFQFELYRKLKFKHTAN